MTAHLRRALGLFLALSLCILTVFEGGDCCRPSTSVEESRALAISMDAGGVDSTAPEPVDVCPFPCAPTGCRAMTGCAPAALTETAQQVVPPTVALHAIAQRTERPLSSRVAAPEPPPPRA